MGPDYAFDSKSRGAGPSVVVMACRGRRQILSNCSNLSRAISRNVSPARESGLTYSRSNVFVCIVRECVWVAQRQPDTRPGSPRARNAFQLCIISASSFTKGHWRRRTGPRDTDTLSLSILVAAANNNKSATTTRSQRAPGYRPPTIFGPGSPGSSRCARLIIIVASELNGQWPIRSAPPWSVCINVRPWPAPFWLSRNGRVARLHPAAPERHSHGRSFFARVTQLAPIGGHKTRAKARGWLAALGRTRAKRADWPIVKSFAVILTQLFCLSKLDLASVRSSGPSAGLNSWRQPADRAGAE